MLPNHKPFRRTAITVTAALVLAAAGLAAASPHDSDFFDPEHARRNPSVSFPGGHIADVAVLVVVRAAAAIGEVRVL